jgi:hypothetical protein
MGTRANIVRANADGSYDLIYTHWEGYPEHHAPILLENYSSDNAVDGLLKLGDLSTLGPSLGTKHPFDQPDTAVCTAYGRDRGETGTEVKHYKDLKALEEYLNDSWTEWVYVWNVLAHQWTYTNNPSPTWFKCCGKEKIPKSALVNWEANEKARSA